MKDHRTMKIQIQIKKTPTSKKCCAGTPKGKKCPTCGMKC